MEEREHEMEDVMIEIYLVVDERDRSNICIIQK
jgi:hypothetical protein